MEENTKKLLQDKKGLVYMLSMIALVAIVALSTYGVLNAFFRPTTLSIPQNVMVNDASSEVVVSWNKVNKADSYTILIINRTTGDETTFFIYDEMYVLTDNRITYNISDDIEEIYNYAIMVRANDNESNELSSQYSRAVELSYVDNGNDVKPYIG